MAYLYPIFTADEIDIFLRLSFYIYSNIRARVIIAVDP